MMYSGGSEFAIGLSRGVPVTLAYLLCTLRWSLAQIDGAVNRREPTMARVVRGGRVMYMPL